MPIRTFLKPNFGRLVSNVRTFLGEKFWTTKILLKKCLIWRIFDACSSIRTFFSKDFATLVLLSTHFGPQNGQMYLHIEFLAWIWHLRGLSGVLEEWNHVGMPSLFRRIQELCT